MSGDQSLQSVFLYTLYLIPHCTTTARLSPTQRERPEFHVILSLLAHQTKQRLHASNIPLLFFLFLQTSIFLPSGRSPTRSRFVSAARWMLSFKKILSKPQNPIWSAKAVIEHWAPSHTWPPMRKSMVRYPSSSRGARTCWCAFPHGAVCTFSLRMAAMNARVTSARVSARQHGEELFVPSIHSVGPFLESCRKRWEFLRSLLVFGWWSVSSSAPWWTPVIRLSAAGSLVCTLLWFPPAFWQRHEYFPVFNVSPALIKSYTSHSTPVAPERDIWPTAGQQLMFPQVIGDKFQSQLIYFIIFLLFHCLDMAHEPKWIVFCF